MSQINIGCELEYTATAPTTFLFNLSVVQTEHQKILSESFSTNPMTNVEYFESGLEHNRMHRCFIQPGSLRLTYQATVEMAAQITVASELAEHPYRELPPDVLPYLNPSRYCESDMLGNFAFSEFGSQPQGYQRVKSICDWTFAHLTYVSGSTDSQTTARDVLVQRQGVCRDFAHLSISLCRGLGIPARYVCGYAVNLQPADFHGFFEAYLGDRWYLFDATRLAPLGGLVRIASGKDAADVPFATLIGSAQLKSKKVWANTISGDSILQLPVDQAAVSTA